MIDFNRLNLRQANQIKQARKAPAAWFVVFSGCGHRTTIPDNKLIPVERRGGEDYFFCDLCSAGDRSGTAPEGFCTNSTLHPLQYATPLFSSFTKQQQQEQEQNEHQ